MSRLLMLAAAGLLSGALCRAHAQSFDFSYSQGSADGILVTESGVLTAQATGTDGEYLITGITGEQVFTIGGVQQAAEAITGLLVPDTAYGSDDLLFFGGNWAYLDSSGFTFTVDGAGSDSAGDVNIALLSTEDGTQFSYTTPYEIGNPFGSLTVTEETAVPEPASYAMLLAGLGVAVAGVRMRRQGSIPTLN